MRQVTEWEFSHTDEEYMFQLSIRGTCGEQPPIFVVTTPLNKLVLLDYRGPAISILVDAIDRMMQLLLDRVNYEEHD